MWIYATMKVVPSNKDGMKGGMFRRTGNPALDRMMGLVFGQCSLWKPRAYMKRDNSPYEGFIVARG
jgi:hypothetical protein